MEYLKNVYYVASMADMDGQGHIMTKNDIHG